MKDDWHYCLVRAAGKVPYLTLVVMRGSRITVFFCGFGVELLLSKSYLVGCTVFLGRENWLGWGEAFCSELIGISRLLSSGI